MTDKDRLLEALRHEEAAVRLYRQFAQESEDERVREMFEQFAMNESWHAAAIRAKLQKAGQ
jgi:rubrerythrin